jgi:hypothetical protein
MFKNTLTMTALASVLVFAAASALAADQDQLRTQDQDQLHTPDQLRTQDQTKDQIQDKTQDQLKTQDQIYGSQLMTEKERNEYRNRMRSAKTVQEQEQIRAEHHKSMQVRAKERGVTLPDQPPTKGGGMGPGGMGSGGGMGPGGGMGGGKPY